MENGLTLGLGQERHKMRPGHLEVQKIRKGPPKRRWGTPKARRSQSENLSTAKAGRMWAKTKHLDDIGL